MLYAVYSSTLDIVLCARECACGRGGIQSMKLTFALRHCVSAAYTLSVLYMEGGGAKYEKFEMNSLVFKWECAVGQLKK